MPSWKSEQEGRPSLEELLEERHAKDVYVGECKTGSSWDGCQRLDAWVLVKTWSPCTTIGYEVKRTRSDFLRDQKWQGYLPMCHLFYFVTPRGVVQPEELPADCGLMWAAGRRLLTKRAAVRREPDPEALVRLMTYVLMSRTRIVGDMWEANRTATTLDVWRKWLDEKKERRHVGHVASQRIRRLLEEAQREARRARLQAEQYEDIKRVLQELGFSEGAGSWEIRRRLDGNGQLEEIRGLAQSILRLTGDAAR